MNALHTALKLKRAGKDERKLTVEEIKEDVRSFWEPDGQNHFRDEEVLLVAFAQYTSIHQPEIVEMLLEHVKIRSLIDITLKSPDVQISTMHELGMLLETHVRKKELTNVREIVSSH